MTKDISLSDEIRRMIKGIKDQYPELAKFILDTPPAVNIKMNPGAYHDSLREQYAFLKNILNHYAAEYHLETDIQSI